MKKPRKKKTSNRKTYALFGMGLFSVFILTLYFNSVVSEEKTTMAKMQHEWTRDEHHLMDELRDTMTEMKQLIAENSKTTKSFQTNPDSITKSGIKELAGEAEDEELLRLVKNAISDVKKGPRLRRMLSRIASAPPAPNSKSHPPSKQRAHINNTSFKQILPSPPRLNDPPPPALAEAHPTPEALERVDIGAGSGRSSGRKNVGPGADNAKLKEIADEFVHAWKAYEDYAWGRDVVKPVSRRGHDEQYRMGITLLDSLDTMWIMGLKDKFNTAVDWVQNHCSFTNQEVSVFETTIRALGGLLAAYHLSGSPVLLSKAEELAKKMEPAFRTPTGFPRSTVRLSDGKAWCPSWSQNSASYSEVSSLFLEWEYLARVTGNNRYKSLMDKIMQSVLSLDTIHGLYAQWISVDTGRFTRGEITLGSRVDSGYEYLEKVWRFSERTRKDVFDEYLARMDSIEEHLLRKSKPNGLLYIQQCDFTKSRCHGQFDHLVCFAPGMFAMGAQEDSNPKKKRHMEIAEGLMETCWESYKRMPTGLAPEIIKFDHGEDFFVETADRHNLLRPETVESLFVMWRVTHDPKYREWGWEIFKSFQKWTKLEGAGYSSISSVTVTNKRDINWRDHTESFFFAETLKYFYLLFTDDDVMHIDDYVFNTEAHAFPIKS